MESNLHRYEDTIKLHPYEDAMWDGKVTVCFGEAEAGWILLWISGTSFLQNITLYTSYAFDPYPSMLQWLNDIVQDILPVEFCVDEEGTDKSLLVLPSTNNRLDFQILENGTDDKEILFRMRVNKRQLISEFVKKFELFRKEYYQTSQWEHGENLLALDLTNLHRYLQTTT